MTLKGKIMCKTCGMALAEARGVHEGSDREYQEAMAIWNCRPNCPHVTPAPFFGFRIEWIPEADECTNAATVN